MGKFSITQCITVIRRSSKCTVTLGTPYPPRVENAPGDVVSVNYAVVSLLQYCVHMTLNECGMTDKLIRNNLSERGRQKIKMTSLGCLDPVKGCII